MHSKVRSLRWVLVATAAFFITVICFGQDKAAGQIDITQLLLQLHSDQLTKREQAYEQLRADPIALRTKEVREGLLDLLDRENQLRESFGRTSRKVAPMSDQDAEEFGNYVGELGETVNSFADWNDPRRVCILVHESYNFESQFADKIVQNARGTVPCLLQLYRSDVPASRLNAAPILTQILAKSSDQLDQPTTQRVRQTILAALRDPNEIVRSYAVRALGMFGRPDMIPALMQVSKADSAFSKEAGGFWIRQYALKAIADIQKRSPPTSPPALR